MRPESPLTTRLPPLNDIGVIPADSSCRASSPAAWPSRPGTIAPSSARLPGRTGRNPDRADDRRCAAQRRSGMADGRICDGTGFAQIKPICAAPACRTEGTIPVPNGGSGRGYLAVGGPLSSPGMAY